MFELPKRERAVPPWEKLASALGTWSQLLNAGFRADLESPERAGNIIDAECRIDMRAFMTKRGGPYAKEDRAGERGIQTDETTVKNHELAWSGAREEWAKRHYGTENEAEILQRFQENDAKHDGALAEAAVLTLLNKFLGERFVAVRAAKYDDYENGVDTLILDRESGGVVCAFDEVVGMEGDERYTHKVSRAKGRLAEHGGMRVKYGLTFTPDSPGNAHLERRAMPNVPGFCISLTRTELHRLIEQADFTAGSRVSASETDFFQNMVRALETQGSAMQTKLSPQQRGHVAALIAYAQERTPSKEQKN